MTGLRALTTVAVLALALAAGCGGGGRESASEPAPPTTTSGETATAPGEDEGEGEGEGDGAGAGAAVVVQLVPFPGSRERGTATLTPLGNRTRVGLELEGGPGGTRSADIRRGTCERPGRRPSVRLEDVEGGRSETEVAIPLQELQGSNYVILVQRAAAEPDRHVACGYLAAI